MINTLSKEIYALKNNKLAHWIVISLIILLAWQAVNILMMSILGILDTAWYKVQPFFFIEKVSSGSVMLTLFALIALSVIYLPIATFFLWLNGGIKRVIAKQLLFYGISFLFLSFLGLIHFSSREGFNFLSYPQSGVKIFLNLSSPGSEFDHRLMKSLLPCYSLLFILMIWQCLSVKTKTEKIFGQAHFANAFEIYKAGLYADQGIILGKAHGKTLKLPGFENALIVAPTGSGKIAAIAIPNLLEWTDSGVFNDLKGELYRLTGAYRKNTLHNECFLWAPADIYKNTSCYNPFFYVSDLPDLRIRDLQLIAETLIPATKLEEEFWYQSSRQIFLTLSMYLLETKGTATLSKINELSKQQNFFGWLENEITIHKQIFLKSLQQNALSLLGLDKNIQKIILKDFNVRMKLFNDPLVGYATSKNDFDFRELRKKKMSIYIQIPDGDKERLSPILTLFWAQLIHVISSHEPQEDELYGVLALMDEFGNMDRINKLKDGLSFLRSYRMRCIIIVQCLAQIYSVYGRYDAKAFLNSKIKVAFALNNREDAKFFSESLGSKTIKVSSSSVSTGHGVHPGSRNETTNFLSRPLMTPDEIMQLSDKKAIILMEDKNPIKANKKYWFKDTHYRYLLSNANKIRRIRYGVGGNTIILEKY